MQMKVEDSASEEATGNRDEHQDEPPPSSVAQVVVELGAPVAALLCWRLPRLPTLGPCLLPLLLGLLLCTPSRLPSQALLLLVALLVLHSRGGTQASPRQAKRASREL